MDNFSTIAKDLHKRLFHSAVSNNLVYNTCWEDPSVDRDLLQLDRSSNIVMLTSAGCNALEYLVDNPREIHCVDINPAQNALLELKLSLFRTGNHTLLWDFFGTGINTEASTIYNIYLRHYLSCSSRQFWDRNISSFIPSPHEPSFYFSGTSGKVALLMYQRIQRKGLTTKIHHLLGAQDIDEQAHYYYDIEPMLWNGFHKWLADQPVTMSLLGVPEPQQRLITEEYGGGMSDYIQQSLRKVFTERPLRDNYFWRVYLTGSYTSGCCPNYLRKDHFQTIHRQIDKIGIHTSTLLQFLKSHPDTYTHFVMLDHQDWMAYSKPDLLAEEWKYILENSRPGTRILFRSAGSTADFLPSFVKRKLEFKTELAMKLHAKDRVGTYQSTHLGIVK